jgi:hypothetical protein
MPGMPAGIGWQLLPVGHSDGERFGSQIWNANPNRPPSQFEVQPAHDAHEGLASQAAPGLPSRRASIAKLRRTFQAVANDP